MASLEHPLLFLPIYIIEYWPRTITYNFYGGRLLNAPELTQCFLELATSFSSVNKKQTCTKVSGLQQLLRAIFFQIIEYLQVGPVQTLSMSELNGIFVLFCLYVTRGPSKIGGQKERHNDRIVSIQGSKQNLQIYFPSATVFLLLLVYKQGTSRHFFFSEMGNCPKVQQHPTTNPSPLSDSG